MSRSTFRRVFRAILIAQAETDADPGESGAWGQ